MVRLSRPHVNLATRHFCIALLLGLLVSHLAIAMHTASHLTSDSTECEFCITYGNLAGAIKPVLGHEILRGHYRHVPSLRDATPTIRYAVPSRSRGPPSSD